MSSWFAEKLERYNVEGIDESVVEGDLGRSNPFMGMVSDVEEFQLVRIVAPSNSKEVKGQPDGNTGDHTNVSSEQ